MTNPVLDRHALAAGPRLKWIPKLGSTCGKWDHVGNLSDSGVETNCGCFNRSLLCWLWMVELCGKLMEWNDDRESLMGSFNFAGLFRQQSTVLWRRVNAGHHKHSIAFALHIIAACHAPRWFLIDCTINISQMWLLVRSSYSISNNTYSTTFKKRASQHTTKCPFVSYWGILPYFKVYLRPRKKIEEVQ